ncbi:MAG: hypothetical protein ACM3QS_00165, partial [Bacteroidota bacterium]
VTEETSGFSLSRGLRTWQPTMMNIRRREHRFFGGMFTDTSLDVEKVGDFLKNHEGGKMNMKKSTSLGEGLRAALSRSTQRRSPTLAEHP